MEPSNTTPPVDYGRRIVPRLVDEMTHSDSQRPFVSVAKYMHLEEGYEDVTCSKFATLATAANGDLRATWGRGKSDTLLYLGPLEIRYLLIVLAATKTGHVVRNRMSQLKRICLFWQRLAAKSFYFQAKLLRSQGRFWRNGQCVFY